MCSQFLFRLISLKISKVLQNRESYPADITTFSKGYRMCGFAAEKFRVKISHRFLERGHTHNEGDSVYSVIERARKHNVIYTPEEWKLLI